MPGGQRAYFFFELFFAPFLAAFLAAFFLATVRPPLKQGWAAGKIALHLAGRPDAACYKSQPVHLPSERLWQACVDHEQWIAMSNLFTRGGARLAVHSFSSYHSYDSNAVTTSCLYLPCT
jgi:hypothetical protein